MAIRLSWTGRKVVLFFDEINGLLASSSGKESNSDGTVRTLFLNFLEGNKLCLKFVLSVQVANAPL